MMFQQLSRSAFMAFLMIGLGACWGDAKRRPADLYEPTDALAFLPDRPCTPPTPVQARRTALALEVLGEFSRHADIYDGALNVFGRPRNAEDLGPGEIFCVSESQKDEVARLSVAADAWRGLVGMTKLEVAFQLGPRDPVIVSSIARIAFEDRAIEDSYSSDIRPFARTVLASFGATAAPWREQALSRMSEDGSLGTSAAQVAAASGDPEAVARVAALLQAAVDDEPADEAISVEAREHITELAFALGAAREKARPYTPIVLGLLNREFTIGSHFGALELTPTSMCRVLRAIGGPEAEAAINGPLCQADWHKWP